MSKFVVFVSDDVKRSAELASRMARRVPCALVNPAGLAETPCDHASLVIVDIDLSDGALIGQLRPELERHTSGVSKVFLVAGESYGAGVQARALGASVVFDKNQSVEALHGRLLKLLGAHLRTDWGDADAAVAQALDNIDTLNDALNDAVAHGRKLPTKEIEGTIGRVMAGLVKADVGAWLEAVRRHHSYTYRHSMIVTGFAVAFGLHFGVRMSSLRQLAASALLHDIGKVRIPLAILDKPGPLTEEERELIKTHPVHSGEILEADGQFDAAIVAMARHHHELLDGSGYPDGLKGDEISDMVRTLTIVDIFSALIDERSYKQPMSRTQAFEKMLTMEGKLDMEILNAFKPVALTGHKTAADLAKAG